MPLSFQRQQTACRLEIEPAGGFAYIGQWGSEESVGTGIGLAASGMSAVPVLDASQRPVEQLWRPIPGKVTDISPCRIWTGAGLPSYTLSKIQVRHWYSPRYSWSIFRP